MPTVPERLRAARETRNMTVEQVADITKLRTDHVRALEEGNYRFFAAPVYVRGFVRTYATLLKLDVPEVMADLEGELGQVGSGLESGGEPAVGTSAMPFEMSGLNWRRGLIYLLAAVVLCVSAIAWFSYKRYRKAEPLEGLPPGIYEPAKGQSGDMLPVPGRR